MIELLYGIADRGRPLSLLKAPAKAVKVGQDRGWAPW